MAENIKSNGFIMDDEGRILEIVDQEARAGVKALTEDKANQSEVDVINGIATDVVRSMANKVKNYQKPDSLTIVATSDSHYTHESEEADTYLAGFRRMAQLGDFFRTDMVSNFGDLINGKGTLDVAKRDLMDIVGATAHGCRSMVAMVRGNHDDNGWYSLEFGGTYQQDEVLNALGQYQYIDALNVGMTRDPANLTGGYGYYDHDASKIRVFVLNSSDIPYILDADGGYRYTSYGTAAFSDAQINFVANALKFADKDVPNDWAALFVSHIPMDTTNDDGYRFGIRDALIRGHMQMLGVINAYKNGTSYSFAGSVYNVSSTTEVPEDFMVNVDVDYSDKGAGDVIAFFSGHTHADNYSNEVGHDRSPSRGYAYLSIFGVGAFVINRADNSITLVKYGSGRPDLTDGATVVAPALGSVADGEWTIHYDQFRPTSVNIFPGWSSKGWGYILGDNSEVDKTTMELTEYKEDSKYITSKVMPVAPSTTYKIPYGWNGQICGYNSSGKKSGYITPAASADGTYKTFTTPSTQYYVVFSAHTSYWDWENMTAEVLV